MKVLVLEYHQESNSFCPVNSVMEDYLRCSVLEGEGFLKGVEGCALAPCGMFDVLKDEKIDIAPGYEMRAPAGGIVEQEVVDHFLLKMHKYLKENMPLDGVLLSLHGATQSTEEDDVCGRILEEVRRVVGNEVIVAASLDLHANVTTKMFTNADYLSGYHTYPHIDVYETGVRAAKLAVRALQEGKQLHMERALIPMIAPACGYSTAVEPLRSVVRKAEQMVEEGQLEDFSIFHMQPWLDVVEGSGVVIAIGKDQELAKQCAEELARDVFELREQMHPKLDEVDDVIRMAEEIHGDKPIIMVDFSDSTNAGAAGDSSYIVERILALNSPVKAAYVMVDRPAVEAAFKAGVGSELNLMLGATRGSVTAKAIPVTAKVRSLHDGEFILEGPSMRGVEANVGRTALLSVGNVDIVVCQALASTGDPQLYRHFGVEPTLYQMVVVKANTSYRAAYEVLAEKICIVDTKGAATADLVSLPFRKINKNMYPFNKEVAL